MIIESISIVVIINLVGLIWCYTQQSDKVTDLFYSLSFLLLTLILWWQNGDSTVHNLVCIMVSLWALRLGFYLFQRIHTMQKDPRFDQMRNRLGAITGFWVLQAISILILSLPIIIIFQKPNIEFNALHGLGAAIWLIGWLLESIADAQKFNFRKDPLNNGSFVEIGLWKGLQHPNYLGEILCWIGIFTITIPSLQGWEWLAILSPIWIITLLVFISGIPLLQKSAMSKYGHLESYRVYRKETAFLIPFVY